MTEHECLVCHDERSELWVYELIQRGVRGNEAVKPQRSYELCRLHFNVAVKGLGLDK